MASINLTIPDKTHHLLKREAHRQDVSMSRIVLVSIEKELLVRQLERQAARDARRQRKAMNA